jgi:hypothetical protein
MKKNNSNISKQLNSKNVEPINTNNNILDKKIQIKIMILIFQI